MSGTTDRLLADLPDAIEHWQETDPTLADLANQATIEPWSGEERDPFAALAVSIIHQQVSLAAGRTIYGRFRDAVGEVRPSAVLAAGEQALRGAGLSGQKTGYVLDLAAKVEDGHLDLNALSSMDDAQIVERLTKVKGIGVWSAKMFLLFHLGRPDVLPWEDLGVRLATEQFYGVPERDAAAWLRGQAVKWSPYNSLAARVLWTSRDR